MALRKEQVLLAGTAVILVLLFATRSSDSVTGVTGRVRSESYEQQELPPDVVVGTTNADLTKARDPFRKPSRTTPLPPLDWPELELPAFPELPLLEPPLAGGASLRFRFPYRTAIAAPVVLGPEPTEAGAGANRPVVPDGGTPTGSDVGDEIDHGLTWDRLTTTDGRIRWGLVLGDDRYAHGKPHPDEALSVQGPFQTAVHFQEVNPEKGTVRIADFPFEPTQISAITFANTIKNRIGLRRRRIPPGDTGLADREAFIRDLLHSELQHVEAVDEAERQAKAYIAAAPNSPRGHELLGWVYATTGQLENELALYESLGQTSFGARSFVARGRGVLEARMGLDEDAESHLREAVRLDRSDVLSWLSLSTFLSERGRAREALGAAREAHRGLVPNTSSRVAVEVLLQLARSMLAVGQADDALRVLTDAETRGGDPQVPYSRACALYAKGSYTEAMTAFEQAAAAQPDSAMTLIGEGLCAMRAGKADEAMGRFRLAAQRDPLERHIALAAQAYVYLLAKDRATDAIARAEEARLIAPHDPYVLYVLGRGYRMVGQFDAAHHVLDASLRDHHDFVEAMAELAYSQLLEAKRSGAESLELLTNAERLATRAVQVEADRGKLATYRELLGVVRYHLLKNEPARKAFEGSLAWGGGNHAKVWLALLRNRLGHVDDAISKLRQVGQFIRDENDPTKQYVDHTRRLLAFHRGKRLLRDEFSGRAKHWVVRKNGQQRINWRVHDGKLKVTGSGTREDPTIMRFTIERARQFVRASIELGLAAGNESAVSLRLHNERSMGGGKSISSFDCRAGWDGNDTFVYLRSGRQETKKNTTKVFGSEQAAMQLTPDPIRLEIEHFTGIDGTNNRGEIIVRWNGTEVARRRVPLASVGAATPLHLDLRVDPQVAGKVDAWFDDFKLIRIGG